MSTRRKSVEESTVEELVDIENNPTETIESSFEQPPSSIPRNPFGSSPIERGKKKTDEEALTPPVEDK